MKRWKKVLIWVCSIIVVLGISGFFAANYAVNKFMDSMAGGLEAELEATVGNNNQEESVDRDAEKPASVNQDNTVDAGGTDKATSDKEKPANSQGTQVASESDSQSEKPADKPENISLDKAKEIQEDVTMKDKAKLVSILAKKLSAADIKKLQELASGGLTGEEKKEARSLLLGKLSQDEYNSLSSIAHKYGASEGRTYEQVQKEEAAGK